MRAQRITDRPTTRRLRRAARVAVLACAAALAAVAPAQAGDFDGVQAPGLRGDDIAVWRPSDGYWHVLTSGTRFDWSAPLSRQ